MVTIIYNGSIHLTIKKYMELINKPYVIIIIMSYESDTHNPQHKFKKHLRCMCTENISNLLHNKKAINVSCFSGCVPVSQYPFRYQSHKPQRELHTAEEWRKPPHITTLLMEKNKCEYLYNFRCMIVLFCILDKYSKKINCANRDYAIIQKTPKNDIW